MSDKLVVSPRQTKVYRTLAAKLTHYPIVRLQTVTAHSPTLLHFNRQSEIDDTPVEQVLDHSQAVDFSKRTDGEN